MKRNIIAISLFILLVPCFTSTMDMEGHNISPYERYEVVPLPFDIPIGYCGVNISSDGSGFCNCHLDES